MSQFEFPVLIVGAGPAGLAAAVELSRRGVPVLLAERRRELSSHPRATVLSLRSMELMRGWGLERAAMARSVPVDMRLLRTRTLAEAADGDVVAVGYPSPEESRALSPVAAACVAQDDVEPLLLAEVRRHPTAEVLLGTEATAVTVDGAGATVALRDVVSGIRRRVRTRWVIAADGARSAVRAAVGIAMEGVEDVLTGASHLLHAPLWDVLGPHRHLLYAISHPEAQGTFLPAGRPDRWLWAQAAGETSPCGVAEAVRIAAGAPDLPVRIVRSGEFSSAAQLAERFRLGPVLLAGDAAHRVTPRGGTGLNLALHDGYDLGWKLAWVLAGWAGTELIDTYEAERRPIVARAATRSADPNGSARPVAEEVAVDLGGRLRHVRMGSGSTLDRVGPGLTAFTGAGDTVPPVIAGPPVEHVRLDAATARALGAPLLVRPDGRRLREAPPMAAPGYASGPLTPLIDRWPRSSW